MTLLNSLLIANIHLLKHNHCYKPFKLQLDSCLNPFYAFIQFQHIHIITHVNTHTESKVKVDTNLN